MEATKLNALKELEEENALVKKMYTNLAMVVVIPSINNWVHASSIFD